MKQPKTSKKGWTQGGFGVWWATGSEFFNTGAVLQKNNHWEKDG